MRSILEEVWYGNVCPNTMCLEATAESKQFMELIARHHNNLLSTLTDKQKETLEKLDECYGELNLCAKSVLKFSHFCDIMYLQASA